MISDDIGLDLYKFHPIFSLHRPVKICGKSTGQKVNSYNWPCIAGTTKDSHFAQCSLQEAVSTRGT